jgi:putative endonuclease
MHLRRPLSGARKPRSRPDDGAFAARPIRPFPRPGHRSILRTTLRTDPLALGIMARSHRFGGRAEELAAAYLVAQGWRILARNWRFHHKEVDLIAKRDGVVAFVEVKARDALGWGHPLEAITPAKRRELAIAARGWIALNGRPDESYRFDAAVVVRAADRVSVEYFEDAWRI